MLRQTRFRAMTGACICFALETLRLRVFPCRRPALVDQRKLDQPGYLPRDFFWPPTLRPKTNVDMRI